MGSLNKKLRKAATEHITPKWCAEGWALNQYFRELGVPVEDIYVTFEDTRYGKDWFAVVAQEVALTFTISVGPVGCSIEKAKVAWSKFVLSMIQASDAERRAVIEATDVKRELNIVVLAGMMREKGFALRNLPLPIQEFLSESARAQPNSAPS